MIAYKPTTSSTSIITIETDSVKMSPGQISTDEVLEALEPFIQKEIDKRAGNLPPDKVNEIKQNVRIKLWKVLKNEDVRYPYAYTKMIIRSVFSDLVHDSWRFYATSYDIYGEVSQGKILVNQSQGWANPEDIALQEEAMTERLQKVVTAISRLPMRTRMAMICSIFERVDDVVQLKQVFESYHVPVDMEEWPDDPLETQRLKALLSHARRRIAQFLREAELVSSGDAAVAFSLSVERKEHQKE